MNKVVLVGRLTKDPDMRYTSWDDPLCITRYALAVDRRGRNGDGPTADFINVVAFGRAAEFAGKYFTKGMRVSVAGRLQTESYEKDGRKVYTTDVVAEEQEFADSKKEREPAEDRLTSEWENVGEQEELPFK